MIFDYLIMIFDYLIMVFECFDYYFRTFLKLQEELCKIQYCKTEILRFRELLGEIFITFDAVAHGKLISALIMLDSTAYNMLHGRSAAS